MNRIYVSLETDPYFNVAAEYQLFLQSDEDTCLFLWQNRPAVIAGRNQNFFAECDMAYLERHQILPVRRLSGGGAVFQDMGNVNFTFLTKERRADTDQFLSVIKSAVASYGIVCTFSGRNDLLYEGKKFSGHAYYTDDGNYLYHGTIMVDVDMDMLSNALKPSLLKLRSKGITSVKSRVINLSQINGEITAAGIKDALMGTFSAICDTCAPVQYISKETMHLSLLDIITHDEWIYGEAPEYEINAEKKLPLGNVSIAADIVDGRVRHITIHTDSLSTFDFFDCEKKLIGVLFKEDTLFDRIAEYMDKTHAKE